MGWVEGGGGMRGEVDVIQGGIIYLKKEVRDGLGV